MWRAASLSKDEGQEKLLELGWGHCKAKQNGFLGEVEGRRQMVGERVGGEEVCRRSNKSMSS